MRCVCGHEKIGHGPLDGIFACLNCTACLEFKVDLDFEFHRIMAECHDKHNYSTWGRHGTLVQGFCPNCWQDWLEMRDA